MQLELQEFKQIITLVQDKQDELDNLKSDLKSIEIDNIRLRWQELYNKFDARVRELCLHLKKDGFISDKSKEIIEELLIDESKEDDFK